MIVEKKAIRKPEKGSQAKRVKKGGRQGRSRVHMPESPLEIVCALVMPEVFRDFDADGYVCGKSKADVADVGGTSKGKAKIDVSEDEIEAVKNEKSYQLFMKVFKD